MNKIKKEKKCFPPKHFTFLLWLCNVIIGVKHMKVVQSKRSFHYIIPGREFSTTSNKKVTLELRVNPQCLEKKNKSSSYLFHNIFNDSPFSWTFFLLLVTAWTNFLFYCFNLYQAHFQTSKTSSSMFSWHIQIMPQN